MTRARKCAVAYCRERLKRGVICKDHWLEVPAWLRQKIALECAELRASGVRNPGADQHVCELYRMAITEVDKKHAARPMAAPKPPLTTH